MTKKVLVLEPDAVFAKALVSGLTKAGYRTVHCYKAQEAILCADTEKFDLVICELLLVSHSGIEFLYEFRSYPDWQSVPVLIFSIVPPTEFAGSRDGLLSGLAVSSYLYKPNTSLQQLIAAAESLLSAVPDEAA